MQALRQLGGGVFIAILSIILVIGGISLALAESALPSMAVDPPTPIPPTFQPFPTFPPTQFPVTFTNTATSTATHTATFTLSPTLPPAQPTVCNPPSTWVRVIIGANDTIYTLAQRYNTSEDILKNTNCLTSVELQAGSAIYVPFVPTVVVAPCRPPAAWVRTHVVQSGDNLYRIALSYGLTYPELQRGNCMGSSITIYAGQRLWVPNIPTRTPVPGVTITLIFPSSTPSFTAIPPTFTQQPIPTATQTFIVTASPIPTSTIPNTATSTPTPSLTPFP